MVGSDVRKRGISHPGSGRGEAKLKVDAVTREHRNSDPLPDGRAEVACIRTGDAERVYRQRTGVKSR